MPELPEVETVRQGLLQGMQGKTFEDVLIRREGLRYPFPEGLAARRRNGVGHSPSDKCLLIDLDDVASCSPTLG